MFLSMEVAVGVRGGPDSGKKSGGNCKAGTHLDPMASHVFKIFAGNAVVNLGDGQCVRAFEGYFGFLERQ